MTATFLALFLAIVFVALTIAVRALPPTPRDPQELAETIQKAARDL